MKKMLIFLCMEVKILRNILHFLMNNKEIFNNEETFLKSKY